MECARVCGTHCCQAHSLSGSDAEAQGWDSRLYYSPQLFSPANPLEAPSREYTGIPIAGWMLYANVLNGVVYDDNVFQTHANETEAWGYRLQPNIEITRNNGIHKTTIYGFADARFYGDDADEGDVFNAKGGFRHVWEAQRDFIVRFEGDAARKTDINNSGQVIVNGVEQTLVDPLTYNEYRTSVSGLKSFDRFFVGLAGAARRNTYDDIEDTLGQIISQDYRNQTVYTFSGRVGIHLSPVFYAFAEPSQNWRHFNDSTFNSEGQRIVAGLGTDRISLFQGEIFAGYQRQDYDNAAFGDVESDVYGGQLYWYPTRDLTVGIEVDKSIGDSTLSSPGNPSGSPVEDTGILVRSEYILSDIWSLSGRVGLRLHRLHGDAAPGRPLARGHDDPLLHLAQSRAHVRLPVSQSRLERRCQQLRPQHVHVRRNVQVLRIERHEPTPERWADNVG